MEIITFYLAGLIIAFIIIFRINKTSEEIGLGTLLKLKKRDCLMSWVFVFVFLGVFLGVFIKNLIKQFKDDRNRNN